MHERSSIVNFAELYLNRAEEICLNLKCNLRNYFFDLKYTNHK